MVARDTSWICRPLFQRAISRSIQNDVAIAGTQLFHKLMRILIVLILLLAAPAAAAERVPTAVVSKDSVVFRVPATSLDERWEIRVPVRMADGWAADGIAYFSIYDYEVPEFLRKNGVAAERQIDFTWTGDTSTCRFPFVTPVLEDGAVVVTLTGERFSRLRPLSATLHGARPDGVAYQAPFVVKYQDDPREAQARALSGPFSADEYAVYQTVIDRVRNDGDTGVRDFLLLSPTNALLVDRAQEAWVVIEPVMLHAFAELRANDDTVADYVDNWPVGTDLSSLAALGYDVMDADVARERWRKGIDRRRGNVEVTMIGFNTTRDQALVHLRTYGGELILLDKIDGEWLVTGRARTFIGE